MSNKGQGTVFFDHSHTLTDQRYKKLNPDWQLFKATTFWALIHRANDCNGYVAGTISEPEKMKHKNCSGCGRKVDKYLLNKIPFLVKMDLVNKAWRPQDGASSTSSG